VLLKESSSEIIFSQAAKEKVFPVIVDMIVPNMGGNEVFATLRDVEPGVRILLCSGYSSNGFAGIGKHLRDGANGFIQRSSAAESLSKRLGGYHQHNPFLPFF